MEYQCTPSHASLTLPSCFAVFARWQAGPLCDVQAGAIVRQRKDSLTRALATLLCRMERHRCWK